MHATSFMWAFASLANAVALSSVLIPLYSYPNTLATWQPVYEALSSYPSVTFQIIVNPSNGPGTTKYPSGAYRKAVAKLNSFPNALIFGYVATHYATRNMTVVKEQVNKYGGWSLFSSLDIAVDGIFFDETPDSAKGGASISYMKAVSEYAYSHIPKTKSFVILNPGDPTAFEEQYLDFVDMVVVIEYLFQNYHGQTTLNTVPKGSDRAHEVVIVKRTPDDADITNLVDTVASNGFGAVYFTDDTQYSSLKLVNEVAAAVSKAG